MIEGEDDDDDDDDEIRSLRARTTSARGGALQQHQKKKGQVLEGARRRRAGGAGRGGQTRAGSLYKEGTRSWLTGSRDSRLRRFCPRLAPPFHVTFTPPAAGKLFYSPGETPVPYYI
ncbi:unnamed protein product [Sphagnum jensenii]|uniref:Uncharacterized protein n=1 Tax=Sphagnum jensenii TaxID=128206 RepID=A0ABP1AEV6_9BRYO